jgi:MerR family transcriptional regulator, redox-sensitive transcriptional activator SoxR
MEISGLSIGEVARRAGVRASAVRFYEKERLLPKPIRSGGRRVYGESILERLAVIEFAKQSGFRLEEIRRLLQGSSASEPVTLRWQALVRDKLEELNVQQERIAAMRALLERAAKCRCLDVAECGRRLLKARQSWR